MSLEDFHQSNFCQSGKNCKECRKIAGWRIVVSKRFNFPLDDQNNFQCRLDEHDSSTWDKAKEESKSTQPTEKETPSLLEQAKNLATFVKEQVTETVTTGKTISKEREHRLEVCRGCEYFIHQTDRCSKCGCYMKAKASFEAAKCPLNKW